MHLFRIFFFWYFVSLFFFAISAQNKCYRTDGKRSLENMSWLWVYYDGEKNWCAPEMVERKQCTVYPTKGLFTSIQMKIFSRVVFDYDFTLPQGKMFKAVNHSHPYSCRYHHFHSSFWYSSKQFHNGKYPDIKQYQLWVCLCYIVENRVGFMYMSLTNVFVLN